MLRKTLLTFLCMGFAACTHAQNASPAESASPSLAPASTPEGLSPEAYEKQMPQSPAALPKIGYSSVNTSAPYVALTFDDGPHVTNTPRLLDLLAKRNIKATFFVVGTCAAEYPAILKRIADEGHELANHSWSHPNLSKMSDEAVRSQLQKTENIVFKTTGVRMKLMRPPYGAITQRQREWINKDFGYRVIMWSVDPLDWKNRNAATVSNRIISGTTNGSIILAHDIHPTSVDAMPRTIDELLGKGYQFVTVSELLTMDRPPAPVQKSSPKPATAVSPSPAPAVR
jgi:peptidoglycan-N-acetylglucosamine deacetylase